MEACKTGEERWDERVGNNERKLQLLSESPARSHGWGSVGEGGAEDMGDQ